MKKKYMAPASDCILLEGREIMLNMSVGGDDKVTDEEQVLVRGKGTWDSDNWSSFDEEE